jgi:hypothetical protein
VVDGVTRRICRETFSEYREIEGIMMPTRTLGIHLSLGSYSARVRDVICLSRAEFFRA